MPEECRRNDEMNTALSASPRHCRLQIPSELGFEKLARELAWNVAKGIGLSAGRCEDFRTAVSEATLNAIEHGNGLDPDAAVDLTFSVAPDRLEVLISDQGVGRWQAGGCPTIEDKVAGTAPCRHMGLLLMQALVDELKVEKPQEQQGTRVSLVMYTN